MEKTEEQKQQILKDLWYKRNPAHDKDSAGVDRFWGTVLCVLDDYNKALTLPIVVKSFYCHSENARGLRCGTQCLGCDGMERDERQ